MASENGASDTKPDVAAAVPGSPAKRRPDGEAAPAAAAPAPDGDDHGEPRPKRAKTDDDGGAAVPSADAAPAKREKIPGIALIKEEYLIHGSDDPRGAANADDVDDDAAEGRDGGGGGGGGDNSSGRAGGRQSRKKGGKGGKGGGQNKDRDFGRSRDAERLCASVAHSAEFSPKECRFGDACRSLHDLRRYLAEGRRGDLETFGGQCPVFAAYGRCPSGWKCRFVSSHMEERTLPDGRRELVLVERRPAAAAAAAAAGDQAADDQPAGDQAAYTEEDDARPGVVNVVPATEKQNLTRKRTVLDRSEAYIRWLDSELNLVKKIYNRKEGEETAAAAEAAEGTGAGAGADASTTTTTTTTATVEDLRAQFVDPPFLASEKRRLYFGPETPVLAPLTTQGNLPFRRLCVELGCQLTYSEMALGVDLVTGKQPEWALMKAHASEVQPPGGVPATVVQDYPGYDHGRDLRFGAQIAANQPWMAIKATEAMARLLPHLRLVDINCGCPIDLVYKAGGGAGLLEAPNKLERMVRGMNAVSGEVPITAKLRVGVRDGSPAAAKVLERLAFGGRETRDRLGAPGCAAVTLHGRTRNQRYKKPADWGYIAECAALVRAYNAQRDALADTAREPDPRTLANTGVGGTGAGDGGGRLFFVGNGDCFGHEQYRAQLAQSGADAVMIGRGALIKPWLFEEIAAGQYLDKTATERLAYVEAYARYGMEAWGTDEQGLGTTRRFLLEYLSFASRYVPVGLLEHLPPSLNDRPPAFRGRNELETRLASRNYKDWIAISEMFLGPAHPDFKFVPKHKSNAYEEVEG